MNKLHYGNVQIFRNQSKVCILHLVNNTLIFARERGGVPVLDTYIKSLLSLYPHLIAWCCITSKLQGMVMFGD